jgi:hypothetical protein
MSNIRIPFTKKNISQCNLLIYGIIITVGLMIYLPVMFHMIFVFQKTDFIAHTNYIMRMYQTRSVVFDGNVVANPLFTVLSLLLTRVLSISSQYAELIVLAINYILLGVLITRELINKNTGCANWIIPIVVISILLYSPIFLSPTKDFPYPYGYVPATSYHNPTVWLAKLFGLWSLFLFIKYIQSTSISIGGLLLVAGVNIASVLSKPNYAMCFLPAAAFFCFLSILTRQKLNWKFLIFSVFLPSIAVLVWQYWLRFRVQQMASLGIAPLVVARNLSNSGPLVLELLLGIVFPLVVFLVYFTEAIRDKWVLFCWGQFGIGLGSFYLLTETGVHQFDGNFLWGPEIALFVLVVISAGFWLSQIRKNPHWKADWIPLAVLVAHGLYGLGYWYYCLTII